MDERGLFQQNIVALIWDFDRTLSPDNMQRPIFENYGISEDAFWAEVNALPQYYARANVTVQPDTCYLTHLLSYVRAGRLPGLTNERLRELGAKVRLFAGLPGAFDRLRDVLAPQKYHDADLRLEHYIVSTGLEPMIRGTAIFPKVDGVWASGFIEEPAAPGYNAAGRPGAGEISQVAGLLDNTTKTRAIFEINKGVNANAGISVNDSIAQEDRRVPIKNMIYIADGPSDIPSFSVMRRNGGMALAVYDSEQPALQQQADLLHKSGRVDMYGAADYREHSHTMNWLELQVRNIADRILDERTRATQSRVQKGPKH